MLLFMNEFGSIYAPYVYMYVDSNNNKNHIVYVELQQQ